MLTRLQKDNRRAETRALTRNKAADPARFMVPALLITLALGFLAASVI